MKNFITMVKYYNIYELLSYNKTDYTYNIRNYLK